MPLQSLHAEWCTLKRELLATERGRPEAMDNVSTAVRSRIMASVGQKDTNIERRLRGALWKAGIRYRKNVAIRGKPDLALAKRRLLIFVDSCFWHRCPFHCRPPKSNVDFWSKKLAQNRRRDRLINRHYRRRGVVVIRLWEHQITRDLDGCVRRVRSALNAINIRRGV